MQMLVRLEEPILSVLLFHWLCCTKCIDGTQHRQKEKWSQRPLTSSSSASDSAVGAWQETERSRVSTWGNHWTPSSFFSLFIPTKDLKAVWSKICCGKYSICSTYQGETLSGSSFSIQCVGVEVVRNGREKLRRGKGGEKGNWVMALGIYLFTCMHTGEREKSTGPCRNLCFYIFQNGWAYMKKGIWISCFSLSWGVEKQKKGQRYTFPTRLLCAWSRLIKQ